MEWKIEGEGNTVTVAIVGDLDLYGAPAFAKMAVSGIESGWRKVILDLSGMDYLDSTGVGAIIRMLQSLKKNGGSMRCQGLHGSPRKVLAMSNMLALLPEERAETRKDGKTK